MPATTPPAAAISSQGPIFRRAFICRGLGPFDLTYEFSEWQPSWYVKSATATQTGYGDGITNYLLSIGHWFGDQRVFGDAVGGQSNMLRVGWEPHFGGLLEAQFRALTNDSFYSAIAYHHAYTGSLTYSYPWRDYVVGTEVDYGRDVYGASYTRLGRFPALRRRAAVRARLRGRDSGASRSANAEIFVDAGVVANRVLASITSDTPRDPVGHRLRTAPCVRRAARGLGSSGSGCGCRGRRHSGPVPGQRSLA